MGVGDLGTWVTIGDLVACVEPSRRRQRVELDDVRGLGAPDVVDRVRVRVRVREGPSRETVVPRAVLGRELAL